MADIKGALLTVVEQRGGRRVVASLTGLGLLTLCLLGFGGFRSDTPHGSTDAMSFPNGREPATGVVSGTVRLPTMAPASGPPRLSPYSRQRYRAPQQSAPSAGLGDVVVYVSTVPSAAEGPAPSRATINQQDLMISPHVTAVQIGAEVDFPNSDDVYHNLFSLSDTKRFNLGRYSPGESRSLAFDKPGLVRLFCDIHSDMAAVILVLEHGYFTRPAADGSYRIEGLPAGRHTVVAWHEALPADSVVVEVPASGMARADLSPGG